MPIISTISTEKSDFKPQIESSTYKSYQAYTKAGYESHVHPAVEGPYRREIDFLVAAKTDIVREVTQISRKKIQDQQTRKYKEVLIYEENWFAKDWKGNDLIVRGVIQGVHKVPISKAITNEKDQKIADQMDGFREIYEIDFSKKAVDKIIGDQEKDYIKFNIFGPKCHDQASYDQFVSLSYTECTKILMQPGGFKAVELGVQIEPKKPVD
jgi:hypothetical protein